MATLLFAMYSVLCLFIMANCDNDGKIILRMTFNENTTLLSKLYKSRRNFTICMRVNDRGNESEKCHLPQVKLMPSESSNVTFLFKSANNFKFTLSVSIQIMKEWKILWTSKYVLPPSISFIGNNKKISEENWINLHAANGQKNNFFAPLQFTVVGQCTHHRYGEACRKECKAGENSYCSKNGSLRCNPGWYGQECESKDPCFESHVDDHADDCVKVLCKKLACKNGAKCYQIDKQESTAMKEDNISVACECATGFVGPLCELSLPTSASNSSQEKSAAIMIPVSIVVTLIILAFVCFTFCYFYRYRRRENTAGRTSPHTYHMAQPLPPSVYDEPDANAYSGSESDDYEQPGPMYSHLQGNVESLQTTDNTPNQQEDVEPIVTIQTSAECRSKKTVVFTRREK